MATLKCYILLAVLLCAHCDDRESVHRKIRSTLIGPQLAAEEPAPNPQTLNNDSKVPEIKIEPPEAEKKSVGQNKQKVEVGKIKVEKPAEGKVEPKPVVPPEGQEQNTSTKIELHREVKSNQDESGTVRRAVLVFVAVSILFIIFVAFRTYCGRRGNKSLSMVRKYGVRTRRSDVEMTPLPLDEDDEDDTLFEVGGVRK